MSDTRSPLDLRTELRAIMDAADGVHRWAIPIPQNVCTELRSAIVALGRIDGSWPAAPDIELADARAALDRLHSVNAQLETLLIETEDDRHALDLRTALFSLRAAIIWLLVDLRAEALGRRAVR